MKKYSTVAARTIALLGLFLAFGPGLFIASMPYREQLLQNFEWKAFVVSLLTYTPTNIAALSLLGSFVGGCASRIVFANAAAILGSTAEDSRKSKSDTEIYMQESPLASLLRGFVVYVAFRAGVYIASNAPLCRSNAGTICTRG